MKIRFSHPALVCALFLAGCAAPPNGTVSAPAPTPKQGASASGSAAPQASTQNTFDQLDLLVRNTRQTQSLMNAGCGILDVFGVKSGCARQKPNTSIQDKFLIDRFTQGEINGEDALKLLQQAQAGIKAGGSPDNWVQLTFSAGSARQGNRQSELGDQALQAARNALANLARAVIWRELDDHFSAMLGGSLKDALAKEKVWLPPADTMTAKQAQSTLMLATMIAATRVSAQVLDRAVEDFKVLEAEYADLLDQRVKAAGLLRLAVDDRAAARKSGNAKAIRESEQKLLASGALSVADLKVIDTELSAMSLSEFANNFDAQVLAMRYLRVVEPDSFASYQTKKRAVVTRSQAVRKSVSGVVAFGAFLATFVTAFDDIVGDKKGLAVLTGTLVPDFVVAVGKTLPRALDAADSTLGISAAVKGQPLFVLNNGQQAQPLRDVRAVVAALKASGDLPRLEKQLFLAGGSGWLSLLHRCAPVEAGKSLDQTVPQADRLQFAQNVLNLPAVNLGIDYSFASAFVEPRFDEERRLPEKLLAQDHRLDANLPALGQVQRSFAGNFAQIKPQQLMWLVVAGSNGYAGVQLDKSMLTLAPSADAVFTYESYIDNCSAVPSATVVAPAESAASASRGTKASVPNRVRPAASAVPARQRVPS